MIALCLLLRKNIDAAAHQAATSNLNLLRKPTEAQASAGNYKKGHARVIGLDVAIENPAGSRRRPEWPPLTAHYGYVKRTLGADGDQLDVFIRPGTSDSWRGPVFVIDQYRPADDGGRQSWVFDEHKCMIGWDNERDATQAYLGNYTPGWRLGPVTEMSAFEFFTWARLGDHTKPLEQPK